MKKRKRIINILCCTFLALMPLVSVAQHKLGTSVVASVGYEEIGSKYSVVHTVGELMTATFTGTSGNKILTQGYHQGNALTTRNIEKMHGGKVYPNPTKGKLYIDFDGDHGIYKIDLFDISGEKVKTQNMDSRFENSLELSELRSGIYFLRVSTVTGKIIITQKIEKI